MAGALCAAPPAAARKFQISLSCGSIGVKANQTEAVDMAVRHGYEAVEPNAQYLAGLSDDEMRRFLDGVKAKNLVWGAAGLPVNFHDPEPAYAETARKLPEWVKTMRRAQVTRIAKWIQPSHDTLTYLANFDIHVKRMKDVGALLADNGMRMGMEYVGPKTSWTARRHPFVHSMAETKELLAAVGRPNIGFLVDSWHWYTAQETEADLLSLTNEQVVSADLNDAPAGVPVDQQMDMKRELPLATGVIDLKAFLGALLKIGFDGPVRAEPFNAALRAMPPEEALAATAAAMKKAFALVG